MQMLWPLIAHKHNCEGIFVVLILFPCAGSRAVLWILLCLRVLVGRLEKAAEHNHRSSVRLRERETERVSYRRYRAVLFVGLISIRASQPCVHGDGCLMKINHAHHRSACLYLICLSLGLSCAPVRVVWYLSFWNCCFALRTAMNTMTRLRGL